MGPRARMELDSFFIRGFTMNEGNSNGDQAGQGFFFEAQIASLCCMDCCDT